MQCFRCESENSATNAFCEACGAPFGLACAACGHVNGQTSRFCGQCSTPLLASAAPAPSSGQALRSLLASGGERKWVTVLFADIRNSTGLISHIDPEQALRIMQPALDAMKDAVHRYDGVVNKLQGDGIMALFGAPRPHEDHAVRGCLAALAMQRAIARLHDAGVTARVGLHTGEVVVKAMQNSLNETYDAAGVTVHLANRMEQMADNGGILLTAATFAGAKHFIEVKTKGHQLVRGLPTPIEMFELVGLSNAPASGAFRSGSRLSPLTGRHDQFAALERELDNTAKGDGRVVGVVGEAGIGKSRLCFEFTDSCRRRGIRVFEARVLAHGKATPFQPVLELLRDYFGIPLNESADTSRDRVLQQLTSLATPPEAAAVLLEFLGVATSPPNATKLDPKARKMLLLDIVRTLARSPSRDAVTVILVEDLHWIDEASEEFVDALADAVVDTTTLLVVNFRPGFSAPLMQRSHYRQISMPPLATAQAQGMLQDILGDDPSLALLSRNIVERAHGNPFFLEELVNSLVERGDFEGARGAYRLKGGIDSIPLPMTVQAVIAARIDRLEDAAKQVLRTASVIGREVPLSILENVAGLPKAELAAAVQHLRHAELLYDPPPYNRRIHAFRHPLIQEVAYRSLLHERRREIHAQVARAMALVEDRTGEHAGLLAYHLEQAGETLKAAQHNMRAAVWVGANDPGQALRSWKKMRELLLDQPPSKSTDYLRMMACGQIVNYGWREGMSAEDANTYFEEASRLALAASDMRSNALIHAAYGRILAASGSADEYVDRARDALALAEGSQDASLQVTLKAVLCHALRLSGRMTDALAMNIEATDHAHEIGKFDRQMLGFDLEIWLAAMRGQTLVVLNRGDEARPYLDRVLNMKEGQVDAIHHVLPSLAYVDLAGSERDVATARTHADRAFALAVKSGSPYLRVYAQACRGASRIVAGQLVQAIDDFSAALAFARTRKAGLESEARILADLADAHRLQGDVTAALATIDEAIAVAVVRRARVPECLARIVRAESLMGSNVDGREALASAELAQAEALARLTGAALYGRRIERLKASETRPAGAANEDATRSGAA
jgi:class 3 adenylate cyclase